MAGKQSKKVLMIGSSANFMVAVLKFIAFGFTGSAAMLAEAFHSIADTLNQVLLYIGLIRSKKKPDKLHQFGYGSERYFYAFIVAISIFAVGGGFSIFEGVEKILHPHELKNPIWAYAVLSGAIIFESIALIFAVREFKHIQKRSGKSFFQTVKNAKDTTIITVVFEDSAALLGLLMAMTGITLTLITGNAIYDGLASVLIGLLLVSIAIFLGKEVHSLILGEALSQENQEKIKNLVIETEHVIDIVSFRSLYIGPEDVIITLDIKFNDTMTVAELEQTIDSIERKIVDAIPYVHKIYIEAESVRKTITSADTLSEARHPSGRETNE